MVYVYAIAEPLDAAPDGTGLEGAPVRVVNAGGLVAVVSDCADADVSKSDDALWLHESVVERLMSSATVLPMQAGTVLADDAAVQRMLSKHGDELLDGLQRVRNAAEVVVSVTWDTPVDGRDPTGAAILVKRLGQTRRAMALAERMDKTLGEMARASTRRVTTTPQLALMCAYLVDRDRLGEFRDRVGLLGDAIDGASVVYTGPWPPYSFAAGSESAAGGA
jgi:hypothetical protein